MRNFMKKRCFRKQSDVSLIYLIPHHTKLWKILKEMGIPDHLTFLLRNMYAGQEATVRTGHGTTDWFQIGKGVRQGCILSPCLQKTETAAASTGEQSGPNSATTPNHTLHNQRFKSWTNWAMKCCLICHIHLTPHQLTSTSSSSTSTPFSRKTLPPRAGGRKCFPRVHRILKHRFLCYRNRLLSPWQKWLDCNGTYFD